MKQNNQMARRLKYMELFFLKIIYCMEVFMCVEGMYTIKI